MPNLPHLPVEIDLEKDRSVQGEPLEYEKQYQTHRGPKQDRQVPVMGQTPDIEFGMRKV